VSTNAAGPSVNIMERMSAAVRRLESDLATTREEMGRCVRQRDGAREECVKLMGEVEEKRRVQREVEELQRKFGALENRYGITLPLRLLPRQNSALSYFLFPTCLCFFVTVILGGCSVFYMFVTDCRYNEALVLLGEKSERVEELQMDIVDLKEGYQHALQRLVGDK
jgi:TATA element modulatory factor 1 TATA binding